MPLRLRSPDPASFLARELLEKRLRSPLLRAALLRGGDRDQPQVGDRVAAPVNHAGEIRSRLRPLMNAPAPLGWWELQEHYGRSSRLAGRQLLLVGVTVSEPGDARPG